MTDPLISTSLVNYLRETRY